MTNYFAGVDIGGTAIKFGLITTEGKLIEKWSIHTNTENNGATIISDIWTSLSSVLEKNKIEKESIIGIGAGLPGFINTEKGIVYEAVNIGWKNLKFKEQLEGLSGLPVYIENDANTAVLGENWQGAGNESKHVIAVTLGTGVGGGIIANGEILNGQNGMAGELGHILIEEDGELCNCGNHGCLETITSATGIVKQAEKKIKENPDSPMAALYHKERKITSKDIFLLAANGDVLANEIINHTTDILGKTFANLGIILNPEKILIGGGVSKAGQPLLEKIIAAFEAHALPRVVDACEIKLAQLGNDAGIIGAAYLVKQKVEGISF